MRGLRLESDLPVIGKHSLREREVVEKIPEPLGRFAGELKPCLQRGFGDFQRARFHSGDRALETEDHIAGPVDDLVAFDGVGKFLDREPFAPEGRPLAHLAADPGVEIKPELHRNDLPDIRFLFRKDELGKKRFPRIGGSRRRTGRHRRGILRKARHLLGCPRAAAHREFHHLGAECLSFNLDVK